MGAPGGAALIGQTLGNYRVAALLGEGGMGAVYLAVHPDIGKKVAIKVLRPEYAADPDAIARFFAEARAANAIGHPNIVDVIDLGRARPGGGDELVYLVMERLEGESLAARLRRGRPGFDETRRIVAACCAALDASHAAGVVHRDLKPDNIFLCARDGEPPFVKVLDFGVAKLDGGRHATRTGQLVGTPAYMSPEQCGGPGEVDARSDVYALGVVLFELVTGALPFGGKGLMDLISGHLLTAPPAARAIAPDVPEDLEAAALRAMAKAPDARFPSMAAFAAAIGRPLPARRGGGAASATGDGAAAAAAQVTGGGATLPASAPDHAIGATKATGDGATLPASAPDRAIGAASAAGDAAGSASSAPARITGDEATLAPRAAAARDESARGAAPTPAPASATPAPASATPTPAPRRRAVATAALAAAGALVAAVAGWRLTRHDGPGDAAAPAGAPAHAAAARPRVALPQPLVLTLRVAKPAAVYELATEGISTLEPPHGAPLVKGSDADVAAFTAAQRAHDDADAAIQAAIAAHTAKLQALGKRFFGLGDDPRARAAEAALAAEFDAAMRRARARQDAARDRALALLDGRKADLTADGLWLRAMLEAERAEARAEQAAARLDAAHDAAPTSPPPEYPRPDYADTRAAIALLLARAPDTAYRASAMYLDAYALEQGARSDDDQRAAARAFLDLAYQFPRAPVTQDAYLRAGEYFALQDDPDALRAAAQAYTWLIDAPESHATTLRTPAMAKLGRVLARLHDWERERATDCRLLGQPDLPDAGLSPEEIELDLAAGYVEAGDVGALPGACASHACPCREGVIAEVAGGALDDDDDATARPLLELAEREFPLGARAPETACRLIQLHDRAGDDGLAAQLRERLRARFAPGSDWARQNAAHLRDVDPIALTRCASAAPPPRAPTDTDVDVLARQARAARGARTCLNEAQRDAPELAGAATLEVDVGAGGVADDARATATTLPAPVTACLVKAMRRHRWAGLAERTLVIPLQVVAP